MSNIVQNINFTKGGLNTDDSQAYSPIGDSPYFLNILKGEDGNNGVITSAKGNKLITYNEPLTLSKCYETKGSYYNNLTRQAYFFVFSQPYLDLSNPSPSEYLYDNRLLCFNEDLMTIDTIFIDSKNFFEIDPAQHLTDIKMLGSWLFFNPVTAQPKMIDVDMAYNYTNYPAWDDTDVSAFANLGDIYTWKGGLFVSNTTINAFEDPSTANTKWDRIGDSYQDESTITDTEFSKAFFAIKVPPLDILDVYYGSDTTKSFNNVRGKLYRFCHRYQYFDNTYSVCSAHSKLTLPLNDELYNGEATGGLTFNNYINIELSLYSAALVKNIEIFFQEIEGDWRRATIINRQAQTLLDDVNYIYRFYNNDSYPIIDQGIPYVIHDAVPDRVSSQEIINKNVLCYARCREGKPNLDKDLIDVTLTPVIESINPAIIGTTTRWDMIAQSDVYRDPTPYYPQTGPNEAAPPSYTTWLYIGAWYPSAGGVVPDDYFEFAFGSYHGVFKLTGAMLATPITLANAIIEEIKKAGFTQLVLNTNAQAINLYQNWDYVPTFTLARFFTTSSVSTALPKIGGFKTGAYHPFCLFYYDEALRRGDAQVTSDMSVYVPSFNEHSPPLADGVNFKWSIDWEVNHEPPTWAKYWKWGYAGNRRSSYFVQYIISSIENTNVPDPSAPEDVANTVKIDLTPLQTIRTTTTANWNSFPNSIIPAYDFIEGDRIRFITELTDPTVAATTLGDFIDGIYDFEIIKFDVLSNMAYIKSKVADLPNIGVNTLAEIYTPLKDTDFLDATKALTYFEFGDLMPIIQDADGDLVHAGKTQNQELTASPLKATGTFSNGDVYHILRTPSKPLCTNSPTDYLVGEFHESMWWSDFYKSDDWDKGKLGLESPVGEVTLNIIRYSNVYLQNTTVNGITTFEADHYKELNDVFGKIISIVEVGDTLKCYQEKKPSSILVGRTEYKDDGSGSGNVVISSAVLGAIRYSNTNYGTTFPESISKNNRYVYGYDIYNGVVWRDSANGIFPISGRYSDIGASVDYKMQSYFKAKSKLLLTSGVEHCHVLTVWDEEYKMLYVSFKDTVNEANNETIVFHEPSDRWITFTEFEYTPVGGYNQILELTYSVVKGFENGIGYEFNLLTRFAKFNIGGGLGTASKINLTPLSIGITMALPDPAVAISAEIAPTGLGITTTLPNPVVFLSWINSGTSGFQWNGEDFESTHELNATVTFGGVTSGTLVSYPSWITVINTTTNTLISAGATIDSGIILGVYPNSANTGAQRNDYLVINNIIGDIVSIPVQQLAPIVDPIVTVQVDPADTSGLVLYYPMGSVTSGTASLDISFVPNNPLYGAGAGITIQYSITKNGVTNMGTGDIYSVVNQSQTNKNITMTSTASSGDTVLVNLKSF